jgi:rhodanese-related sulfurtransferase
MRIRGRIPSIKPARAADRFFSGTISLVDVRSDREHRAVRVPCATHIPLPQLHRRIDEIRIDRPVALLCRSGHRSALATLIAQRHGLDAMSVTGGMRAWLTAGRPAVWPRETTPEMRSTTQASPALPTLEAAGERAAMGQTPELDS